MSAARRDLIALLFPKPSKTLALINASAEFARVRRKFAPAPVVATRFEMYDCVVRQIGPGPVDYLEFGVWRGESITRWTGLNTHAASRFVGFDTFEGLPEDWHKSAPRGTFDVGGTFPQLADARASFVKGLFQNTLEPFLASFRRRSRLVVHVDCDLYSATLFTLASLDRMLAAGDVLIFDDFSSLDHEFTAFCDYERSFYRTWTPIAAFGPCTSVAVLLTGRNAGDAPAA